MTARPGTEADVGKNGRKKLLLDATKTFECRFATGIQRVVRELVRRRELIGRELGVDVVPVVASGRGYRRLDARGLERLLELPEAGGSVLVQSRLAKRIKSLLQIDMRLYAALQHRTMRRRLLQLTAGLEPVAPGPGDVVALIDEFAGGSPSIDALAHARQEGASTLAIVFDLIPLLHPDMVPVPIAYLFRRAFGRLSAAVDGLIAISKSGAELIRDQPAVRERNLPVASFYLGQDPNIGIADVASATIPTEAWPDGPTFVMVGTIEPRKRHEVALAAFERLWAKGCAANLLMIGRIGWEVDALVKRVVRHPEYGRSLFLCTHVCDRELRDAVARASAMIMASKAEGFGLPLVEALGLGTPVIAADIPVFREVAGDAGSYFDPDDIAGFAAAISRFIAAPEAYRQAAGSFRWIDWNGSARQFAAAAYAVLDAAGWSRAETLAAPVHTATLPGGRLFD